MPRIRDYSGFGGNNSTAEAETPRERVFRMPEVPTEDAVESSAEKTPEEPKNIPEETQKPAPAVTHGTPPENATAEKVNAPAGAIDKIIKPEKDLAPKYSKTEDAINSILNDGDYYEDYVRGEKAELLKSKDFVLAAIAQNGTRFYAPETPKPSDWLDEEYLAERAGFFFERTRESVKPEENQEFSEVVYTYLRKAAFSPESYKSLESVLKLIAKVNSARITSLEDGERFRTSVARFSEAVNSALNTAKEKHAAALYAEKERAEKLSPEKKDIHALIDAIEFQF